MQRRHRSTLLWLGAVLGLVIMTACGGQPPGEDFTLTVTVAGAGAGTVVSDPAGIDMNSGSDDAAFREGTEVTLTATPAAGSTFTGWSGDCSGTGTCVVTMDGDASVTATFGLVGPSTATLTVTGKGNGDGNVTSDPAGIDLDLAANTLELDVGTTVTLTATAAVGSQFGGWDGGGCSGTGTCVLTLTADVEVFADFFDPATDLVTDTFNVLAGSDDAEEFLSDFDNAFYEEGGTQVGSSDLDLTYDAAFDVKVIVGIRFAEFDIPGNAVITSATINFTRAGTGVGPGQVTLSFAGQASDDAATFVDGSANSNISNRPTTTATVDWESTTGWDTTVTSPNLAAIVREIIQRDGWQTGNALAFIIDSDDSDSGNYRRARSFEADDGATAPVLSVTYYVPTAP